MTKFIRTCMLLGFFFGKTVGYCSVNFDNSDSLKYASYSNSKLLNKARKASENDSYDEAKSLYLLLVQRDSANSLYNYECGLNYFLNLFEQPKSLPFFEKALKYSTQDTIDKVYYYLGEAYQLTNKYDNAIECYNNYKRFIRGNKSELEELEKNIEQCKQGKAFLAAYSTEINIDNLGTNINTSEAEYVPVVKNDESIMLYTARRKSNVGGEIDPRDARYYEDMFESKGDSGLFHVGERFYIGDTLTKRLINTGKHESVVSISYDEKLLITFKNNSLWFSELVNDRWGKPVRFDKNINMGKYQNHGSYSVKNDTLYFSSNAHGGYGGMDIYMSVKQADGKWGKAKNLGPAINTKEDEDSPTIDSDNKTLYFSSKGHNSIGGFDIYKTTCDSTERWNEPLNLGMPINSSGDDIYFKYNKNKKQAYFSSSRQEGFGDYDIYRLEDYAIPRFDDCTPIESRKIYSISLDASQSVDPKGVKLNYQWNLGDGKEETGDKITHDYNRPGKYPVKLYVLDPIYNTLEDEYDTVVTIFNVTHFEFLSKDTNSVDSAMVFDGTPTMIENSTIIKYHWSFGDSTQGTDSVIAKHLYKNSGSYEVKLSIVARNDSTSKIFQKCITKNISILNKNEFMKYYLASLEKKKGFDTEMLNLARLQFLAPDTSVITAENEVDGIPVHIPKSHILKYTWNFGDSTFNMIARKTLHAYGDTGVFPITLNVLYQVDSSKAIYEASMNKNIVILTTTEYDKMVNRRNGNKPGDVFVEHEGNLSKNYTAQIDTMGIPEINLENIYFDFDKSNIRNDAEAALSRNIEKLKSYPMIVIKITANTDSRGSSKYNFKLSERRAKSAIAFLEEHGISKDRIVAIVSQGETQLLNNCKDKVKCTEQEHQMNRRDEFKVVGNIK